MRVNAHARSRYLADVLWFQAVVSKKGGVHTVRYLTDSLVEKIDLNTERFAIVGVSVCFLRRICPVVFLCKVCGTKQPFARYAYPHVS